METKQFEKNIIKSINYDLEEKHHIKIDYFNYDFDCANRVTVRIHIKSKDLHTMHSSSIMIFHLENIIKNFAFEFNRVGVWTTKEPYVKDKNNNSLFLSFTFDREAFYIMNGVGNNE